MTTPPMPPEPPTAMPPPLPPQVIGYAGPPPPNTGSGPDLGPLNISWKDNLIQLACVIAGTAICMVVGKKFWGTSGFALGLLGGLLLSTIISGAVIGILRRKRQKPRA